MRTLELHLPRRRWANVPAHVSGLALVALSVATGAGLIVEFLNGESDWPILLGCTLVFGLGGLALWWCTELSTKGSPGKRAAQSVGITWLVIAAAGALPYMLTGELRWDLALFESISGLTGTGASVVFPLDEATRGVLFYRQMTQWVGGMGILVLAVAILPFLGVGGMELFRAESPGSAKDRLVPRISEAAQRLGAVYVGLTIVATGAFLIAGTSLYDAAAHAVGAVATGGFSPHPNNIGYFDSVAVELAAVFGMFIGAVKFPLIYSAVRGRDLRVFWRSAEFRFFVALTAGATLVVAALNVRGGEAIPTALHQSAFNVTSLLSSTGFATVDFTKWVPASQLILLFVMATGAMAGSTSGGLKLFRLQVLFKHAWREVRRVRRPRGIYHVRLGAETLPEDTVRSVLGYVMLYVLLIVAGIVVICLLGADLVTTTGAVVGSISNGGQGFGAAGPTSSFLIFDLPQRFVLMALMLLGRLEVFPLILFMVPMVAAGRRGVKRLVGSDRDAFSDRV